jgi:aminomethyltransferase
MTLRRHTPVNLRQSGNSEARILINTQVRKSPYWHLSERHGCWAYTVLSNLYHPRAYVAPEDGGLFKEHEYLTQAVTLWNVAAERQIAIKGPDAETFANLLVTRELKGKIPVGKARYTIVCNEDGGIVNDPVLLRVAEDEIWLSTHTEVLFYAQGVRVHSGYDVRIEEVDVSPLQIQGPNSKPLMESLVEQGRIGREVLDLKYYTLCQTQLDGSDIIVTRTGFSGEVGYELYPFNATDTGETVWNAVLEAGQPYGIQVIAPSHIRRLEAGILSYHADMDHNTTPYEVGLDWQVDLEKDAFIGQEALKRVHNSGVGRRLVGLKIGGTPIDWYNPDFWPVLTGRDGDRVGYVTSALYSPKLNSNIALAMLPQSHSAKGTELRVELPDDGPVSAEVVPTPFHDPEKRIPRS